MMEKQPLSLAQKLALLLECYSDYFKQDASLTRIAQKTNLTYQGLSNLLSGEGENPRLSTLVSLCRYFGVSLDYLNCETEWACRAYLEAYQSARSPIIEEIARQTLSMSPQGKRNLLKMLTWLELYDRSSLKK
jgi:transcriptional regulator with XRE-family HTH domain